MPHDFTCSRRDARAALFTNQIMSMLRDYLPPGRDAQRLIYDEICTIALEQNLQIISVPPEFDALTKLELERRMVETHPGFIRASSPLSEPPPKDQS